MTRRVRESLRRVPAPLALLLAVVLLFSFTWAVILPAWGGPDEDGHFAYAQGLAEDGRLPEPVHASVSSQQRLSMDYTNTDATVFFDFAKPEWSRLVEDDWDAAKGKSSRSDGGGGNAASQYPPAYYLIEAGAYKLGGSSDTLTRLYIMRVVSLVWLLVATAATWLLAGELFGRRRPLQLVAAAAVGLWPMMSFLSGVLSPDLMSVALSALATWLAVSLLKRGPTGPRVAGLCVCVAVALITKPTSLALVPATLFALAVVAWRLRRRITPRGLAVTAAVVLVFAIPIATWVVVAHKTGRQAYGQTQLVRTGSSGSGSGSASGSGGVGPFAGVRLNGPGSVREFASYLWQFYLPRLPFMHTKIHFVFPQVSHYPAFQVWVATGWAVFGWVNVWFPNWVYYLFLGVIALAAVGLAITVARRVAARRRDRARRRWRIPLPSAAALFVVIYAATLLAGLHRTDFRMYADHVAPFLQGRYLFPLAPVFGVLLAQSTRALPVRFRPGVQGAVIAGLVVFQVACLGLVVSRYYA